VAEIPCDSLPESAIGGGVDHVSDPLFHTPEKAEIYPRADWGYSSAIVNKRGEIFNTFHAVLMPSVRETQIDRTQKEFSKQRET
jgi:hypothetical protein